MAKVLDRASLSDVERTARKLLKAGEVASFQETSEARPVIRAGLLEQLAGKAPRGIRVRGARIEGALDLSDCTLAALILEDCDLPETVDLRGAQVGRLSINGSRFSHLVTRGATISGGLNFGSTRPFENEAWIDAGRTTIRGGVDGCDAKLKSPPPRPRDSVEAWEHNYALRLSECDIQGNVILNGLNHGKFVADGGVCMDDCHVKGSCWIRGADLIAGEGDRFHPADALHAHAAIIDGFLGLNFGFSAKGRVWLQGIKVRERLSIGVDDVNRLTKVDEMWDWGGRSMNQAVLLHVDQAEIGGSFGVGPITIDGAIGMAYMKVARGVSFHGEIRSKSPDGQGVAINARGAQIGGDVSMNRALLVEGKVSFVDAKIAGSLNLNGARIDNATEDGRGVALDLAGAEIGKAVLPGGIEHGDAGEAASIRGQINRTNLRIG